MKQLQRHIAIVIAAFAALSAEAQVGSDSTFSRTQQLDDVVITGTRTPKSILKTPVLTQLITHADIEKADATNLRDLLQQTIPGLEFTYAMSQQVHLNFSGFGGQSVLVLVDGERLAGETLDDVDFERLTMDNVDHVEIVKGAASALYGSNATGGVINVITKDKARPFGVSANVRWGRHNEHRAGLSLQNAGKRVANLFSASLNGMDNYNVSNKPDPKAMVVNTIFGGDVYTLNDRFSYRPTDRLKLSARAGYFYRQVKRSVDEPERYRDFSGGLKGEWALADHQTLEASYAFDQYDKSDYIKATGLDVRDYSNVQNSVRALYTNYIGQDVLTAGADFLYDYLFNTKLANTPRQRSVDVFTQYDWTLNDIWEIVGALRYDYFSDGSTSRLSPKLSLRHTPVPHLNVRFGYGMGFRAPTLKEKYYDFNMIGVWIVEGNPDLKAEVSNNFNLSLEYTRSNYSFLVNGYYNIVKDKITTGIPYYPSTATDQMPHLPYINLHRFRVGGLEAQARVRWACGITARVNYNYTHEQVMKAEGTELPSSYIPSRKHSITCNLDYSHQFSRMYTLTVALNGRWLSAMHHNEFVDFMDVSKGTNRVRYPAYTYWRLSAQNSIGKHVKVNIALDNLLNYKPDYHYLNAPLTDGTNLQVGASVSF